MTQEYFNFKQLFKTLSSGTWSIDTVIAAGKNLTAAAGAGAFDWSNATGTFKTSTGTNTLYGNVVINGSKTFTTGTGAATFNGNTTLATGKSLTITDADAITVGGNILHNETLLTFPLPASTALGHNMFVAQDAWKVTSVAVVYAAQTTGVATVNFTKCTGTTAPDSGTEMLTSAIDLHSTADTVAVGSLSSTPSDLTLASGDRIGIKYSASTAGMVGGVVTIKMKRV